MTKTKVLVVDDSALMRRIIVEILTADSEFEVVGAACDPYVAWDKIQKLTPDVLTLDVEMPRMDGLTFLEKLMRARPMPVVMLSSLTQRSCDITLRALELGAVDFITKPRLDVQRETMELAREIVAKVKAAARAKIRPRTSPAAAEHQPPKSALGFSGTHKVIAVGSSTGGTEALREVLTNMPADSPGTIIVQHMPEKFTRSFAERLDGLCQMRVREAEDGDRILPGHVLIARGDHHMEVVRNGLEYRVRVFEGERVNHHRPSVDVLFHSCARVLGVNAVGVILTGMGGDGSKGLLAMRRAGARTLAQDEATSVVFGMPREAIALGAAEEALPIQKIAGAVLRLVSGPVSKPA